MEFTLTGPVADARVAWRLVGDTDYLNRVGGNPPLLMGMEPDEHGYPTLRGTMLGPVGIRHGFEEIDHRWVQGWFIFDPLCLIFLAIVALYFVLLEGLAGATVGKWLLGLRVVRIDGSRPGLWKGALRNVLRLVDSLPTLYILGAILILSSAERARLGDRIAGTRVIRFRS